VACLELAAGLQLEGWDACDGAQYFLSGIREQVKDLNNVLGRLKAADFVDVVLGHQSPLMLKRPTGVLTILTAVGWGTWPSSSAAAIHVS